MNFKYLFILISFLYFSQLQAQFCNGNLGNPVVNISFGTGLGYGSVLESINTPYTYSSSGPLAEGQYTVVSSTAELNDPALHIIPDHSGSIYGDMMVVNSSSETAKEILYTKKISGLCSDATYQFSAWIINLLNATSPNPNVIFKISNSYGKLLGSINTGDIGATSSPEWMKYGFCFGIGSDTDVVITIINTSPSANPGSTLALDDITISPCGPLLTATIEDVDTSYLFLCPTNTYRYYTLKGEITYKLGNTAVDEAYSNPAYFWQIPSKDIYGREIWIDYGNNLDYRNIKIKESTYGSMYKRFRLCIASQNTDIYSESCRICSNVITFDFPAPPRVTYKEIIQPTCEVPTGTITVSGGNSYSIDGKNFQSSNVFSGLKGGVYSVTLKNGICDFIAYGQFVTINTVPISKEFPTVDVIQPVSCTNPLGTITITSLNYEYSFDNGATWTTNNVKSGLVVGDYNVKTRNSSNCEINALSVSILVPPDSPITPSVTVTQPDCLVQTGTIRVSDVAPEYSFDNRLTWTTSNSKSNLVPGKYKVLLKNTLGCVSYVAKEVEIKAYINTEPLPVATTPQQFCIQQNATLSNIAIKGTNIKWYDAAANGNLLPATTVLQSRTYYATQTVGVCESLRIPVAINIQNTSAPTAVPIQDFCISQKATIASLVAMGTNIKWYNSATNGTVFPTTTALVNGATYYATQTVNDCESINRLAVSVSIFLPSIVVNDVSDVNCDDKNFGFEVVNLTVYNSKITTCNTCAFTYFKSLSGAENKTTSDQITTTKNYKLSVGTTIIYVRIDSNDKCFQVVKLSLTLFGKPKIPISDIVPICENKEITIDAGSGFDSYLWSTGATSETITVANIGSYSVTVTQNHGNIICSSTKDFSVVISSLATISEIKIQDWTDAENVITVEITGASIGNYEYSLDGISYQESNTFTGLRSGDYFVYVRDKNGCGIANQEVFVLSYPKYFTPNGDGYNDTWSIRFSQAEPNMDIKIFDRYGKLIKEIGSTTSWDGTFNGHELPSTDYWFVVTRANGKVYKGHFAMKR